MQTRVGWSDRRDRSRVCNILDIAWDRRTAGELFIVVGSHITNVHSLALRSDSKSTCKCSLKLLVYVSLQTSGKVHGVEEGG